MTNIISVLLTFAFSLHMLLYIRKTIDEYVAYEYVYMSIEFPVVIRSPCTKIGLMLPTARAGFGHPRNATQRIAATMFHWLTRETVLC